MSEKFWIRETPDTIALVDKFLNVHGRYTGINAPTMQATGATGLIEELVRHGEMRLSALRRKLNGDTR